MSAFFDLLTLDLSEFSSRYGRLVINQDGITYFLTDGVITQTFHDTYQGAKPYGIYTENGVELWPFNYMDAEKKPSKPAIPQEFDYSDDVDDDEDDYFSNQMKSYDDTPLSSKKKSKAKKR